MKTIDVINNASLWGFPHSSVSKESTCNAGEAGLIPGSGRSPGEGNGNPLQYSCLENPMDRRVWQATVHEVARVRHDLMTKPPQCCYTELTIVDTLATSSYYTSSVYMRISVCFQQNKGNLYVLFVIQAFFHLQIHHENFPFT